MEMAEDPSQTQAGDEEIEGETDESIPLSTSQHNPTVSHTYTVAEDLPAATDNLDEVDPFTYKPPFTLCDKIMVSNM